MTDDPRTTARWLRWVPAGYLLFGLAWVLGSDRVLGALAQGDLGRILFGSSLKGVIFVVLTTAMLHLALSFGLDPVRAVPQEAAPPRRAAAAPAIAFVVALALIAACAWAIAQREIADIRAEARQHVQLVAELKASQVESWYQSNVGIVESIAMNHGAALDVQAWLDSGDPAARRRIFERLQGLRGSQDFRAVQLFNLAGEEIAQAGPHVPLGASGRAGMKEAVRSGRVVVNDLELNPSSGELQLQIAAPLHLDEARGVRQVAVLLVTVDGRELLTGLGRQPFGDEPLESVLVRSDGPYVHYVTSQRRSDGAPALPVLERAYSDVAGVRVLQGERGAFETRSYRGLEVLAAGAAAPDTPWHTVAMLDTDFIRRRVASTMVEVAGLALVSIATMVTLVLLWWQAERRRAAESISRAAERADAAEARLGWISDYANDAMLLIGEDGRLIDANKAALRYYGYTRDEMRGLRIGDLRLPTDRQTGEFARQFASALGDGWTVFETVHVRKDGSHFPVEVSAGRVEHQGRRLVQSIVRDISERRRTQEALTRSEARYRMLFDAIPYPLCVHDIGTLRVLLVNQAAAAEYGYSVEDFTQLRVDQMVAPSERSRMLEHVASLAGTGRHLSGTWRNVRRDGSEFEVEIVSHPITFDGREARILIAANVTERVRAQRELAASEARYRLLFTSSPQPLMVFDAETLRFLNVNDAAIAQYGYSEAELLAMSVLDIRPEQDAEPLRAHLATALSTGIRASGIWRHRRKDGSLIDVDVVSHPITYAGRPARLVLAVDVTARVAAERALRESESRFRTLFEQIPDGVAHADTEGLVIAANDAWLRMLGYDRSDLGRLRVFDVLEDDETPRFSALLDAARSGQMGNVARRERWRHRRRDGSRFVAEVSSRLLPDGSTLGVVHDLTGQIEVQQRIELQRDMFELLTLCSKAMARATNREELFQHVAELVVEKGEYRFAWFGELAGDVVVPRVLSGRDDGHLTDARASIDAGRSPSGGELARLLRSGVTSVIQDTSSYPNLLVSEDLGHRRGIRSLAMLPIRTHGQVTHGLLVYADRENGFDPDVVRALEEMASDVSFAIDLLAARAELAEAHAGLELKVEERTRALAEARDRAEAADRAKSVFLSSVSHELRSPLHSIIGFTSVLLEGIDGVLNEAQFEHLRIVRDASQNLLGLINDLIDISKLEAGLMPLDHRPFAAAAAIRRASEACRAAAEAKGLALSVEVGCGDATIDGDEARFEQALGKLLSNAVLYTDRGSVTVRCRRDGDRFEVAVTDTGRGIAAADLPRLFDRFTQFDPGVGRLRQGTGLGLAIAYGLVTGMGGTLGCVSEVDHGSTFTITLPVGRSSAAASAAARE